ncbi:hypothetical protein BDR04DRAFT_1228215 [Suillus decipiens]|nr:hypothetical protein BDR04DRAFT_1228215 [Suillus decipiens]
MLLNTLPDNVSSKILEPLEKRSQRHLLMNDLEIRIHNMMKCFANTLGTLPPPSTTVCSVWNQMPNDRVDTMPVPPHTDIIFLRAPSITMDTTFAVLLPTNQYYSCPSNSENSCITQPYESPIFTGEFEKIIDVTMEELRVRGFGFVVESLLIAGAQSVQSAPLFSMVVQTTLDRLAKKSPKQMTCFERTVRAKTMELFHVHWKAGGHWRNICSTSSQYSARTLIGVNKAGLVGSLFSANVVMAEDIALCLSTLLEDIHFDRLCAIHALLVYADDRLCKQRNLPAIIGLKEKLRVVNPLTGLYLWAPVPHARAIMQDIFDTIEGWMAVQAHKREQCRNLIGSYSTRKPAL